MACGPTSAVNSLIYLQNVYSSVYTTRLVPDSNSNGVIDNDEMVAVAQVLAGSSYMNTTLANGTYWSNFGPAIQKYIGEKDPGVTAYNNSILYGSGSSTAWNFLYQQLLLSSDLEILIQKTATNSGSNHFLTVYGINWDDQTLSGTLSYIDPWGGLKQTSSISYNSANSRLELAYNGLSWIYAGESERTIVPVPSSLLLLGSGLIGLIVNRRKKLF